MKTDLNKLSAEYASATGCSIEEARRVVTIAAAAALKMAGRTDLAAAWLRARGAK